MSTKIKQAICDETSFTCETKQEQNATEERTEKKTFFLALTSWSREPAKNIRAFVMFMTNVIL